MSFTQDISAHNSLKWVRQDFLNLVKKIGTTRFSQFSQKK